MRVLLKIAGSALFLVLLTVVGGFVYLSTLDLNQYRGLVAQKVEKATGRKLVIHGELRPKLSWVPTLAVTDVTVDNASWGEKRPAVDVELIEARMHLWPLISSRGRNLIIDDLVLKGATVFLETNEKGDGNWSFDTGTASTATAPSSASSTVTVDIRTVELRNVTLAFKAAGAIQKTLALDSLTLDSGSGERPRRIKAAGKYNKLKFTLEGDVGTIEQLAGGPFPLDLALKLGDRGRIRVAGEIREPGPIRNYTLAVTGDLGGLSVINDIAEEAGLSAPPMPALGPLHVEIAVDDKITKGKPSFSSVKMTLGKSGALRVDLSGTVRDPSALFRAPATAPGFRLDVKGEAPDLAMAARTLGVAVSLAGPAKLSAQVADNGKDTVKLTDLHLEVAGSDVTGDLNLRIGGKPAVSGTLRATRLELAGLSGTPDPSDRNADRVFSDTPLALERLTSLDANLALSTTTVVLPSSMEARNVDVVLALAGGKLALSKVKLELGGGTVAGGLTLGQDGAFATNLALRGLDLGSILLATRGISQLTGGRTDADIDVHGSGKSVRQIMANLGGSVFLHVGSGTIRSEDLKRLGFADLIGIVDKSLGRQDNVKLNCVVGQTDITGGVASYRTLVVDTSRLTMVGRGRTNLADETLDMRVDPRGKIAELLSTLPSIRIKGTIRKPVYTPDVVGTATDLAGAIVRTPGGVVGAVDGFGGGVLGAITGGIVGRPAIAPNASDEGKICARALAGAPVIADVPAGGPDSAGTDAAGKPAEQPPGQRRKPAAIDFPGLRNLLRR